MCNCPKHPSINGIDPYRWNNETPHVYPANPPSLGDGDELLFDEPGRCGGLDAHSHHFRLVKNGGCFAILVRHGGGDERIGLNCTMRQAIEGGAFAAMDTHTRFWFLHGIYSLQRDAKSKATQVERSKWSLAAAEKRIKTRKTRGYSSVKVWIEEPKPNSNRLDYSLT